VKVQSAGCFITGAFGLCHSHKNPLPCVGVKT